MEQNGSAPVFSKETNQVINAIEIGSEENVTLNVISKSGIILDGHSFGVTHQNPKHLIYTCQNRQKKCGSCCSASFYLWIDKGTGMYFIR